MNSGNTTLRVVREALVLLDGSVLLYGSQHSEGEKETYKIQRWDLQCPDGKMVLERSATSDFKCASIECKGEPYVLLCDM